MSPITELIGSAKSYGWALIKDLFWANYLASSKSLGSQYTLGSRSTSDSDGNVYISGTTDGPSTGFNGFVSKFNKAGDVTWQRRLRSSDNESCNGIAVDSTSNVYACGGMFDGGSNNDGYIIKHDSSGNLSWRTGFTSGGLGSALATDLVLDSSENAYVSGRSGIAGFGQGGVVIKYQPSSAVEWKKVLRDSFNNDTRAFSISIDSSSNVYITGYYKSSTSNNNNDAFVAKIDSSGALQWQRFLVGINTSSRFTVGQGIYVTPAGDVYVGGYFRNSSNANNAFFAKYNTSGTLQWQRYLADENASSSQNTAITHIYGDSFGNIYPVGYFKNTSGGTNAFICKYNSSGTLQWQRSVNGSRSAANQYEIYSGIRVNSLDELVPTGALTNSSGGLNALTSKLPNDGSKTGSYVIDANRSFIYSISSLTEGAGILTDSAGSLTYGNYSGETSSITIGTSALTLETGKVVL